MQKTQEKIKNYHILFYIFNDRRLVNKEKRKHYRSIYKNLEKISKINRCGTDKSNEEIIQFTEFVFGLNVAAELLASKKLEEEELVKILTGETRAEGLLLKKIKNISKQWGEKQ